MLRSPNHQSARFPNLVSRRQRDLNGSSFAKSNQRTSPQIPQRGPITTHRASGTVFPGTSGPTDTGARPRRSIRNWPVPLRRIGGWTLLGFACVMVARGVMAERPTTPSRQQPWSDRTEVRFPSAATESGKVQLIREGTVLEKQPGIFKSSGGRLTFYVTDSNRPLHALENLALERVWRLQDMSQNRQWCVSGIVTEYRDTNYLLITRAVLKMAAE